MKCETCKKEIIQRTTQQNRALHLFFDWIAGMFNEVGHTYTNIMGIETIWSALMVKELIWKPLQYQLYGTNSTTKLNNEQLNIISEAIILHFSEMGYYLEFPNIQALILKKEARIYNENI